MNAVSAGKIGRVRPSAQSRMTKSQPHGKNRGGSHADLFITVIIIVLMLAALAGCGGGRPQGGHGDGDALYPRLPKVTGRIDLVQANPANPRHFRILHITDYDGRRWEFQAEGWAGVSAGHLKDHQLQGTPVTVWYERGYGNRLTARFVGD